MNAIASLRRASMLFILSILLLAAPCLFAQAPATQASIETRVYNVTDLVGAIHQYPYQSAIMPPAHSALAVTLHGPEADAAAASKAAIRPPPTIEQLSELISSTIYPDSWRSHGGSVGSISAFGGGLVITQTSDVHGEIQKLLADVAREVGLATRSANIRLIWLSASPADLSTYFKKGAPTTIDPAALDAHPQAIKCEGRLVCYFGQTVNIASGSARSVINQLSPVVANSTGMYSINTILLHNGLVTELTPQLLHDNMVTLDVRCEYSQFTSPPATQPSAGEQVLSPDRLETITQQLNTTIRLPFNTPTLVGGMTVEPANPGTKDQLYLIAEVLQ